MVLLEIALLLVLTVAIVMWLRGLSAARARRGGWRLEERSDAGTVRVLAVRAGDAPLELGAVPVAEEDFDSRLYEVRAQAREKLAALNDRS
jgi:hypothetical protein